MRDPASGLSRRRFLGLAAAAGSGLLTGCTLWPGSRAWPLASWAEPVFEALLEFGPLAAARAREYPRSAISREFPVRSLELPEEYADMVAEWTLDVDGLVGRPATIALADLAQEFERTAHITRHDCVEGWSAIAEWGGVRVADLLAVVRPAPAARHVVFYAADADGDGDEFYGSLNLREALHPQALLAYEMNGRPLSIDHGAPLRLKVPTQLGYKSTKFVHRVSLVASLDGIGEGRGGYWEDQGYERFAGI